MSGTAFVGLWGAITPGGALDLRTVSATPGQAAQALRAFRGEAGLAEWQITRLDVVPVGPHLDARNVLTTLIAGVKK